MMISEAVLMEYIDKIFNVNCNEGLKLLPDKCINTCVTSPPYYGLRDYGTDDQIGLENTPEQFIEKLVEVFREVKRVLRDDGTLWLNIGDSYNGYKGNQFTNSASSEYAGFRDQPARNSKFGLESKNLKPKDLIGIPWMLAFALRADGWYLRQDIIWHKPNPMPESVTDRCTKSHEYIFLLSKNPKYYYDFESIKTEISDTTIQRLKQDTRYQEGSSRVPGKKNGNMKAVGELRKGYDRGKGDKKLASHSGNYAADGSIIGGGMANKKSVWTVTTRPFKEAHFATFPERLIIDCIKAGCPENGIVLDPFMGAGTTALVAKKLNRNYTGFEINADYIKISDKRLNNEIGLFL